MHTRVLLKISGEQLAGKGQVGIDPEVGRYLARECQKIVATGCQLVLVVGGGNIVRGAQLAGNGIRRVTADHLGMLSGVMNAMALADIFESENVSARCMSIIYAQQVVQSYSSRLAEKHLQHGRVVIIGGGTARPYVTNDTAGVSFALELDCEVMLKATKVAGVYDKDPAQHQDATLLQNISYQEALANESIKVMDKAALGLAMENALPLIVLDPMQPDNILKAVQGELIGSHIS